MKKENEIVKVLNETWLELQDNRFMCYTIKELAYEIAYRIGAKLEDNFETTIMYRYYNGKNKIIFPLTEINNKTIFFAFDIIISTGMFGDVVEFVRNGKLTYKLPKTYKYIDDVFEDEEEEAI
jgi:hypothetical protein